jgi:hypothetical protein
LRWLNKVAPFKGKGLKGRLTNLMEPDMPEDSLRNKEVFPKRLSAAAVQRLRKENQALKEAPVSPLPAKLQKVMDKFAPHSLSGEEWALIRPIVVAMMSRSKIRGEATFPQHLSDVTLFVAWAHRQDKALEVNVLLDHELIEEWVRTSLANLDDATRSTRRSRLRSLASHINPGPSAPPTPKPIARTAVKPPYNEMELAAIIRLAQTQPTSRLRRQLCAMVGLGLGAGLDSADLRALTVSHIEDHGQEGIWIQVPGPRPRSLAVRRRYEDLVRIGLEGLGRKSLVLGNEVARKNITGAIVYDSSTLGNAPHIEQSRLRSTWLVDLMNAPIPLSLIMRSAGLVTARSLSDLLPNALARGLETDATSSLLRDSVQS